MSGRPFVVGVDLDGVCSDYVSGFRQYVSMRKNVPVDSIGPATDWEFHKVESWPIADRDEYLQLHADYVADGGFVEQQMIPGTSEALWELSDAGFYIRIVTHRLINKGRYENVVEQTARWLRMNDIPFRGLCFERHKADLGCDVYIDDSPNNIAELQAAGKRTIVFDAPYNQPLHGVNALRGHDWSEVVGLLKYFFVEVR